MFTANTSKTQNYVRTEISLGTIEKVAQFVEIINSNKETATDSLRVENEDGSIRVEARSMMMLLSALADANKSMTKIYFVNVSNPGINPAGLDKFRPLTE